MSGSSATRRVPVIVLTGFLGSGKTSLLNRLMHTRPRRDARWAIVVNEFGEVGIDRDLLPGELTRQVELPGGCICCMLSEDLDKTLLELIAGAPDLETIVIETTGVAEPLPIAWAMDREPLAERVRLAAVITVVDTLEFLASRPLSVAVDAQVEYADILVLAKMDLLPDGTIPQPLAAALAELNPDALRISGQPDEIAEFLWTALEDPALLAEPSVRALQVPPETSLSDAHSDVHGPRGRHGLTTVWLPIDGLLDFEELTEQLEALPASYVRIKGIARVIDESTGSAAPRVVAFHRVGTRVSCEPIAAESAGRIVALGTDMDRARLAACLTASMVTSAP